jgi:NADH-quinone oxidoreductase subunit J
MFIFLLLFLICFFALATISVRNPVHSVLGLVSVFLVSAALLFCLEVEFLAFSFIIVYVGAIAILFLFVVMMLDIKIGDTDLSILKYGPLGYFITFIFALEITRPLVQNFESIPFNFLSSNYSYINWFDSLDFITNIEAIGQLLYTYYFVYFLMAGFILFIAMIGALMLTLTFHKNVNQQLLSRQLSRQSQKSYMVFKDSKDLLISNETYKK